MTDQNNFESLLAQQMAEVQTLITESNQMRRAYTNVLAEIKKLHKDISDMEKELEIMRTHLRSGRN